jgi:aspartyl-tRNA(Asn)/glutamyl-tRNA(Gln) amidotransferase subunit C
MAASDSALSKEDVRKVAHLARLALTPEDEDKFARQLGSILGYIQQLQKVDVSGVEPMAHAIPLPALERPDVVRPSLTREEALKNAPQTAGEGVAVPKIIE